MRQCEAERQGVDRKTFQRIKARVQKKRDDQPKNRSRQEIVSYDDIQTFRKKYMIKLLIHRYRNDR